MKILILFTFLITMNFVHSQDNPSLNVNNIPQELKAYADAVIRLEEQQIVINSQRDMDIINKRIVTVLNEKGDRLVGAGAGYNNFLKIKKIEAVIYDENGNETKKIKKKDFIDHSAVDGSTLYSDSRVLFMNYNSHTYPYTVEFTVEYKTPNTASIPSWRPINSYNLGVEKSNFSIIDNANLGLRYKEKNFDGFSIQSNNQDNALNYSIENITAYIKEDLSPSLDEVLPKVMVAVNNFHYNGLDGQASNWQEFGYWVKQSLLQGRDQVSSETKAEIIALTQDIQDPLEKAKKVYNYVQDNTRYISVQVGIGGIQPIAAMEVDKVKYGDCKGLTNYTQALLNVAGVESYYTHVEAGQEKVDFDPEFASLEQGNHIILALPYQDDLIWMDCTSQVHPFGFIGDFTDNRSVLMMTPEGGKIVKTSDYVNSDNRQITEAEIQLSDDASIKANVIVKTTGIQYDNRFFIERESKENIEKFYKYYWGYINGISINSYEFLNNKETVEFTEKVAITASDYASNNDSRLIFEPNIFDRNQFIPNRYRNRKLPFTIGRGYLDEDHFIITIPNGYEIESIPENIEIKSKFGEYSIQIIVEGEKISYSRKLIINKGSYPKSDYQEYRNFRKDVSKKDNAIISLTIKE